MKTSSFTLAEVLVTLVIIGVVSALTIPQLIQNSKHAGSVNKYRKTFGSLQNTFNLLLAEGRDVVSLYAPAEPPGTSATAFLSKYSVVKNCVAAQGCFPTGNVQNLDGTDTGWDINQDGGYSKAILADGTLVGFSSYQDNCTHVPTAGSGPLLKTCGSLIIDINGFKGPYRAGVDVFEIWISSTGIYPIGSSYDNFAGDCIYNGWGCGGKILTEGEINY